MKNKLDQKVTFASMAAASSVLRCWFSGKSAQNSVLTLDAQSNVQVTADEGTQAGLRTHLFKTADSFASIHVAHQS